MATPFSRSTRSIEADQGKLTLVGIIFSSVLLLGWMVWFVGSGIEVNQSSTDVEVLKYGDIHAFYTPKNASKMRIGQKAEFRILNTEEQEVPVIPAQVMDIKTVKEGKIKVKLSQEPGFYDYTLDENTQLEVAIVVEKVSPAVLLLEKTGLIKRDR